MLVGLMLLHMKEVQLYFLIGIFLDLFVFTKLVLCSFDGHSEVRYLCVGSYEL